MIGSKFAKVFILGMSITVFSSGLAFADTGSGQSAVVQSADTAVSSPAQGNSSLNEDVLKKQKEIDMYVFEQHAREIADKGFMVTHTAPMDNYVEIGITPYNEVNADYLYKALGKELIKVVEGQQAVTMDFAAGNNTAELAASSNIAELAATSNPADLETTSNASSFILAGVVGAAVLGGTVIVARRRKAARR